MPIELLGIFIFILLGLVVGFFAGLLGIGGGGIMVPALISIFTFLNFPAEYLLHMALATSMAAIVPTALASLRAHHKKSALDWAVIAKFTPGILLGTFAGTYLASYLSAQPLAIFFVVFMTLVAINMLRAPKLSATRSLPNGFGLSAAGSVIGAISALVAIGGGTLTVPFLCWCNFPLTRAIATSAAVGLPIALAGALGYALNGWGLQGLPEYTLGFIYWPGVLAMAAGSLFSAPLGASYPHRLPVVQLRKLFALLLLGLAVHMLIRLVRG